MPVIEAHFFASDDVNGSTIFECSTDDQFVKQIELDIQRDKLGSGGITFARKVPTTPGLFTTGIVLPEVFVRYLIPSISETKYLWGNFIGPRQQKVVSKAEKGGRGFTFSGPGPKAYLRRMLLWSASFAGRNTAVERENHIWTWPSTARAGAILAGLFEEEAANPHGPFLPDLTQSFGEVNDSGGVPWADDIAGTQDFTLKIRDDYLKILWQLEDASEIVSRINLGTVSNPLLQLDAYQSFGRDLQGDLAADTVHFIEGVNIGSDLEVEGSSHLKGTHALVKGNDGVYEFAVSDSFVSGGYKKVVPVEYPSSNNATLDRAGRRFLRRQENDEKGIKLRVVSERFDPETGHYAPGFDTTDGHYWVGDIVSLTTGQAPNQTELDYDAEPGLITGIQIELLDAVKDDDADHALRSLKVEVELNEERTSSETSPTRQGQRGSAGPVPVVKFCRPATFASGIEAGFIGALGEACSSDTVGHASDHPPWSGEQEEYVEITSAEDVPAGGTILVGVSANRDGGNFGRDCVVYDEQGNTYVLDSESPPTGTSDHMGQVWRSVLDTPIVTGDYIRFAWRSNATSGGRCIAASAWDGPLGNPTVGTEASGFNGSPQVADSPVDGITFLVLSSYDDGTITGDGDWNNLDPYVNVGGSGSNTSGLLTEYLQPGNGQGWNGSIDQSRNWSITSVGYSAGEAGSAEPKDGHPDLVGPYDGRVPNCAHRHDVHRDTAPTEDDDWATAGYKVGTLWAQLDDLDNPTEIVAVYILADDSTGAAVWLELPTGSGGGGGGASLGYQEFTSPVGTSQTVEASATQIVSLGAIVYAAVPTWFEFFCPNVDPQNTALAGMIFYLFDGSTSLGIIGYRRQQTNAEDFAPLLLKRRLTPSAGSHTYSVRATTTGGTSTANAGAGGAGNYVPGYLRATLE